MEGVSVIIPAFSYGAVELLKETYSSLFKALNGLQAEVIVIDNATFHPEDSKFLDLMTGRGLVKKVDWRFKFKPAQVLNYGASIAKYENLFFMHQDVMLPEDIFPRLSEASKYYSGDKLLGAIAPAVRSLKTNYTTYGYKLNGRGEPTPVYSCPSGLNTVDAILYNCMLIQRPVFVSAGGFDESYSWSHFDADFCMRLSKAGYDICTFSQVIADHYEAWRFKTKRSTSMQDYKQYFSRYIKAQPQTRSKKKLLVVKLLTLGDCICSIPTLKKIREQYVGWEITFVTNRRYASVFKGHDICDEMLLVEDMDKRIFFDDGGGFDFYDQVTSSAVNSKNYDKLIELNALDYPAEYKRSGRNFVQFYADLAGVTLSPEEERPVVNWDDEDAKVVDDLIGSWDLQGRPMVVFQRKAGWGLKNWGDHNYGQLFTLMSQGDEKYAFISLDQEFNSFGLENVYDAGQLSFNQIACLLGKADCFIGPDSGFHHMASGLDCPTVLLVGCANPIVAQSYSKYRVALVPETTCPTPCLFVHCHKSDSSERGCTQDIRPEFVAQYVSLFVKAKAENLHPMNGIMVGNTPLSIEFGNWEWTYKNV